MTKLQLLDKLTEISKMQGSKKIIYTALAEESTLLEQLLQDRKLGIGAFQWGNSPLAQIITIR